MKKENEGKSGKTHVGKEETEGVELWLKKERLNEEMEEFGIK